MKSVILVDTGPLVALLDRRDQHHAWAVEQFKHFPPPFLTCEAVLAETAHLVRRAGIPTARVIDLVVAGGLVLSFDLGREAEAVAALAERYADRPMDLADACLVRMAELHAGSQVLTLDSDFHVYRASAGGALSVIHPASG